MFFNSETVEDLEFKPLAEGLYTATVVACDYGPTAKGDGAILKVEYSVDGHDQKIIDNFNLENPNPVAVKIGKSQLKNLCEKIGRPQLKQPTDLIGGRVKAKVSHREYNGEIYLNVDKYLPAKTGSAADADQKPHQQKASELTQQKSAEDDFPF